MTIDHLDPADVDAVYRRGSLMRRDWGVADIEIEQDATESGSIDLRATPNVVFGFPAAMDGTEVTFQISFDEGTTWKTLIDAAGAPITQTFTASSAFALPPEAAGAHLVRLVSDATETAARTIKVTTKS